MATPQEFSRAIKEKYPQYANVDDFELARKMVEWIDGHENFTP